MYKNDNCTVNISLILTLAKVRQFTYLTTGTHIPGKLQILYYLYRTKYSTRKI